MLGVMLSLPATLRNTSSHLPSSDAPDWIISTIHLAGKRLSGSVRIRLPLAFVAHAVRLLTSMSGVSQDTDALLDDTAGELANMVAGRVAVQLAADGYPCTLSTPSVSRGEGPLIETDPGVDHGRTDLLCDGHWLSLDLKCHYADP